MSEIKRVSEEHKELYHYTTVSGLQGVLRSQQLWATDMRYLNDPEEHAGFFVRRLPKLLEKPSREAVSELMARPGGRLVIMDHGGPDRAIAEFRTVLSEVAHKVAFDINEPYLVSFCSCKAHDNPQDGLLSQWRGYGTDGGYAIVFDTAKLERLLEEHEGRAFEYQFANFCDVDYDFPDDSGRPVHPERTKWEAEVQEGFKRFLVTQGAEHLNLHMQISALSSRYKHPGFCEEKEVRIVAIPIHDTVHKVALELAKGKPLAPRKPIKHRERDGLLIPYLELFGGALNGPTGKLPILRILVGPHRDRENRAAAVRSLVKQLGLDIPVEASRIPYLGR